MAAALARAEDGEVVVSRFVGMDARLEVGSGLGGDLVAMTASMEALHRLTERVEAAGGAAVARSQFSADPDGDALAQVDAVDAEVVVVPGAQGGGGSASAIARLLADADADVAVVLGSSLDPGAATSPDLVVAADAPVVVVVDGSDSAGAACSVAGRVAAGARRPLRLVGSALGGRSGRRFAAAAAALQAQGLVVAIDTEADAHVATVGRDAALVVVPLDAGADAGELVEGLTGRAPVVAVRGRAELAPLPAADRLTQLADRLAAVRRPATADQPAPGAGHEPGAAPAAPT